MPKKMDYIAMGERVRKRRRELGMTQERLAELAAISISYVGHIERGEKKASVETVVTLCDCLNVSADYLLCGRVNPCDLQKCELFEDMKRSLRRFGQ